MKNKLNQITKLLPEGLSEESVIQIAELVSSIVEEQVEAEVKTLSSKVMAFLSLQKDAIKESALNELAEENDLYRNATLFEEVRTLMSLELNSVDESNVVYKVSEEKSKVEDDMQYLVENFEATLQDKDTLESELELLRAKVVKLEESQETLLEDNETLQEAVSILEEENGKPFESSERAIVISENKETLDGEVLSSLKLGSNEFLTEEVLNLCNNQ